MKTHTFIQAPVIAFGAVAAIIALYMTLEPIVSYSQVFQEDSDEFRVRQTITGESSFLVQPSNVAMSGSISGLTGGQATGTAQFSVLSNSTGGYRVDIAFENNGTNEAMIGDLDGDESVRDYGGDVSGQPSKGYTASTAAQFAYTVTSSTTADTDQSFFHDGGANCNTGSDQSAVCWKAPDTIAFPIVQRSGPATSGATSTITFNVTVPSSADPTPTAQTYTATATLSLYNL